MKKITFLTFFVFLSCCAIYGQISTKEEPISFGLSIPVLTKSEKTMKSFVALDMKTIEQEDRNEDRKGVPPRFGYSHEVNYTLDNSGEWVNLPNGDSVWRLVISCQDALTINLLYDKFWIPAEAKFFVYGKDRKHTIGAITSTNNKGSKNDIQGFATGLVYGDQITLEYYLPKKVEETGVISVSYVVHGYRYVHKTDKAYGQSANCNINVNCPQGQPWQDEKNAIAMILVNGNRYCSGSLVNTTANDSRPLFLTANHCLGGWANSVVHDAETAPNLNDWSFYWHYESPNCASTYDPPFISTSCATVIANNSASDFALLRLSEDPRYATGVTPYYLGWDRSGNSGTGGVGIHHPSGDIKKISLYSITPTSMTYSGVSNAHWRTVWSNGTTEGGSSGSPLINATHRVIGQLHGGLAECSKPNEYDAYGKFSVSWTGNGNSDIRRRLDYWLDPNNIGVSILDGCNGVLNFTNQTVTGSTTVTNCGSINIQNVTVTSTGSLNVGSSNKITINPPFSNAVGSTLRFHVP